MCPKLIELLSWNGPTVHVCCVMLARPSTKTFVSRIHVRQPSPKTAKKSSLAEKFVSMVTRQPRYHCISSTIRSTCPFQKNRFFCVICSSLVTFICHLQFHVYRLCIPYRVQSMLVATGVFNCYQPQAISVPCVKMLLISTRQTMYYNVTMGCVHLTIVVVDKK